MNAEAIKAVLTICRAQHDPGPPYQLERPIAVGHQSFKLSTVGGAKIKAYVRGAHALDMTQPEATGNLTSGGEH